jgi:ribosomal 50S subunit-associated protein YjgA (DUF615 family)
VGDVSNVRADLSTLNAQHRNLDEIFESYRKRDAQRVSTSVRRAKKEETDSEDPAQTTLFQTAEDIVKTFEGRQRGN